MKAITQSDVANKANVSVTTVSRVINRSGYVAPEVAENVKNAIFELGYIIPAFSVANESNPKIIGLLMRKTDINLYFEKLSTVLNSEANKANFHMLAMYENTINNINIKEYVLELLAAKVCAIIIVGFSDDFLNADTHSFLKFLKMPIVFIERGIGSSGFSRIQVNNSLGTKLATSHLLNNNHKHFLYISRQLTTNVETSRQNGFIEAINERDSSDMHYLIVPCPNQRIQSGYNAMRYALEEDPNISAVVTWYDGYAAGAMQYLYSIGKKIPDDIEIVGFDDTLAELLTPPLSSVRMPFEEMAKSTIKIIQEHQKNPCSCSSQSVMLEPKLVLRGSTINIL